MGDRPQDQTQPQLQVVTPETPTCVHHWVLGEPVGNQIPGRCKRCGARRVYHSSIEGTDRFDDYREITASSEYYAQRISA